MTLDDLVRRVTRSSVSDNALDIEIDIALFHPDEDHVSVRANAAGTKLVYTRHDGRTDTCWADDHTLNEATRKRAADRLRALSAKEIGNG